MFTRNVRFGAMHYAIALAVCFSAMSCGAAEEAKATAQEAAASVPAPGIEPAAEGLLQQMGKYLGAADHFSFHAEILFDDVLQTGQKLQFSASNDIALQRPGRLLSEYQGELGSRRFSYDGKQMTLYDPMTNMYASEKAASSVDKVLEELATSYGFSPPLSDFLYSDPYKMLRENVQFGFHVGTSDIAGVSCQHLAFVENHIDWQIWIKDGEQPVPCKIIITYKTIPGSPQFTALLSDWDFSTPLAEPLFEAQLPGDAQQIEFLKPSESEKQD